MLNNISKNIAFSSVAVRGGWYKSKKSMKEDQDRADGSIQERFETVPAVDIIDLGNFVEKAAKRPEHYDVLLSNRKWTPNAQSPYKLDIEIKKDGKNVDGYEELGIKRVSRASDPLYAKYIEAGNAICKHYKQIKGL